MEVAQTLFVCAMALAASWAPAQPDFALHATPVAPAAADPAIARALRSVDPSRIQETIQTLVRFGTRSTLSGTETDLPPGRVTSMR
ncbi:MAG TPA: hypothetical protein VMA34_09680 [Terracidiphilus sp.]|nr:hypothetical protein [Terracidiphilus sp.]